MNSQTAIATLYLFMLAAFLGYQVISRVPSLLHTPLMSATNAISGISLVGSLVAAGAQHSTLSTILGFIAVTCATTNVVGGFIITDRMLRMFKKKRAATPERQSAHAHHYLSRRATSWLRFSLFSACADSAIRRRRGGACISPSLGCSWRSSAP